MFCLSLGIRYKIASKNRWEGKARVKNLTLFLRTFFNVPVILKTF